MALTAVDRNLLQRCLNQEQGAWKDFVDRFLGLMVHVVQHTAENRGLTLPRHEVDDICAEIMLSIVANDFAVLRHFRGQSSLATYLTVVARRVCVRLLLARRPTAVSEDQLSQTPGQGADVAQQVSDREQIERMFEGLGGQEADVVRRFHVEGKSYRQISEELNIPENTIGSILSRARAKMRRATQEQPQA